MNIFSKVIGFLLLFQLAIFAAKLQNPDKITKSFSPKEKVEIKLVSGDCIIEKGNSDKILVEVEVKVSDMTAFKPNFYERGNRLIIEEDWSGWSSGTVLWHITVPQKTEIELETASSDISLRGLQSDVEINTASGDAEVFDFSGELEINTASGEVMVENSEGEIDISVASGDINVSKLKGNIEMSAASGDIKIEVGEGEFDVSCASGDIEGEGLIIKDNSEFSAASGDIELSLGRSAEYDLSISTASGDITLDYSGHPLVGQFEAIARKHKGGIDLPVKTDKEETFTRHGKDYIRKTFSLSGENPRILLETASGKLTLKK
jgi:DUF4097 and DUF4098 domain-containing protein YvlB